MRAILVTGSDTGVGKTHVAAALARMISAVTDGSGGQKSEGRAGKLATAEEVERSRIQIVKVVETGRRDGEPGDADRARELAGADVEAHTLVTFAAPLSPPSAAALEGRQIRFSDLVAAAEALPACDWRIYEGAGGIATPLDGEAHDWADFAQAIKVDSIVVVVPDRLGAINQARLAYARAALTGIHAGVWLNANAAVDKMVADSTREGLKAARIPLWAEQKLGATAPIDGISTLACVSAVTAGASAGRENLSGEIAGETESESRGRMRLRGRIEEELAAREAKGLRRTLRLTQEDPAVLNLADNDYLALAHDPVITSAITKAAQDYGSSASASPLITGWREPHAVLTERLAAWHGLKYGMLWSSGFAANSAVLGGLPARGDIVFADRLIHASMIAGLLRSGARLQRYEHLRLDRLEALLEAEQQGNRQVFVVTETVFSMDGDYPDLVRMADLKRRFNFCWIVDEAHALGWYGPQGAGLVRAAGVESQVDVLVGTLGKALGSGGAYALFNDEGIRDFLVNTAGEFIYSTALPPTTVAAAAAALERTRQLAGQQPEWHRFSREFRTRLRAAGWNVPEGDSPIVPVMLREAPAAMRLVDALRTSGILAGAVRPPTVPAGTSRLRFSLKRTLAPADLDRVLTAMAGAGVAR